jgi:hypothetical protein
LPAGYTDPPTDLPCAEFFNGEETEHDINFDPDMLTT